MRDKFEIRFTREEEGAEICVLFSYSPGYAPTWWQPGEGEEVEILKAHLDDDTPVSLTDHERKELESDALKNARTYIANQQEEPELYPGNSGLF